MAAAWKQDYPNIQRYYIFQIWPRSCSMGINGSDNMLREVQRNLPSAFSTMSIMSTLGIKPPVPPTIGGRLRGDGPSDRPLVERDHYGKTFDKPVTPPDLKKAWYTSDRKDEIALEFDQPMAWKDALVNQFHLEGQKGGVASGAVSGNVITLKLKGPSAAQRLTYLDSASWNVDNLLYGENGIAALTFCAVPILPSKSSP